MPQTLVEVLDENYVAPVVSHRSATAKSAWVQAKSQTYEVNPNTVTFGVEVECYLPLAIFASINLRVGGYHNGAACPTALDPQSIGWKCEQDGSISNTTPSGYGAVEFISPALCGMAGYVEVMRFMTAVERMGAIVNRSCGVHVSVGLASIVGGDEYGNVYPSNRVRDFIRRLLHFVSIHENGLIQIGGCRSRVNNTYCRTIKGNFDDIKKDCNLRTYWDTIARQGRYTTINLQNSRSPNARVEFRVFCATVNPLKILGYISVALGIMHKSAASPVAPKATSTNVFLPDVVADTKAALRLHVSLWTRYAEEKFGLPDNVWRRWGKRILKNQRWNAKRFINGRPADAVTGQAAQ